MFINKYFFKRQLHNADFSKKSLCSGLFIALAALVTSCSNEKNDVLYLDYAASSEVSDNVLAEFLEISKLNGNSSGINSHAKYLKGLEKQAAKIIANKINADSDDVHFTASATVSNNIAILGVAYKNPRCHLVTSKIEHKSVLNVFKHLTQIGYDITYIDVDRYGNINLDQLRKSIRKNTKLISIQMLNSEIGTIQNIKEIGNIAKEYNVLFHTDAAQSFCKYDIDVNDMNIDLLTISGHKIGSPKGIAALYVKNSKKLQPIIFGSGDDLFPGTKPVPLICAFAKAVSDFKFDKNQIDKNYSALTSELLRINDIYINSTTASHIVSVSIGGVLLSDILDRMKNYSFSAGCSCLGQEKSNVIEAIDPNDKLPACTIRISFFDYIKESQLLDFARTLKLVVDQLRKEKDVNKSCQSISDTQQKDLNRQLKKIDKLLNNGK